MTKYISNKRYFLGLVLSVMFLLGISFFFDLKAFSGSTNGQYFTNFEFIFSAAAILLLELSILVVSKKTFKIKMRWGLVFGLLFFFAASVMSIILYKGVENGGKILAQLSTTSKIRYIILAFILYASMYEMVAIIPHFVKGHKVIRLAFLAAIITGIVAIVYSYLTETNVYKELLNSGATDDASVVPISFTSHRNVYAFVLFCSMMGEAYLSVERPHWWRWVLIFFFYANQFFVMSKTCVLTSTFFLLVYIIYSFVRSFKRHKAVNIVFLLLLIALVAGVFLAFKFVNIDNSLYNTIRNYVVSVKERFIGFIKSSAEVRIQLYEVPFQAVKGNLSTLMFGFGYGNEYNALAAFGVGNPLGIIDPSYYVVIDNAWCLSVAQGGVFGLLYTLVSWAFGLVLIARAFKRRSKYAFMCLLIYVCMLFRTMFENTNICYFDFSGVCYFVFAYFPLLIEEYKINTAKLTEKTPDYMHDRALRPSLYLARAFVLSFLPSFFLIALARKLGYIMNITYLQSMLLRYGGIIMFFVSPFVLGGILLAFKKRQKGAGIFSLIIYLAYVASIFVCPLFTQSKFVLLIEVAILLLDFFVLSMAAVYKMSFFSLFMAIGNYIIFAAVCGGTYLLFQRFARSVTLYSVVAVFGLCIAICLYLFFMPRRPSIFAPFEDSIERFEISYSLKRLEMEKRFEAKTEKIFKIRKRG